MSHGLSNDVLRGSMIDIAFSAVRMEAEYYAAGNKQAVPLPYRGPGYMPVWLGFQPRHPGSSFAKWPEHLRMRPGGITITSTNITADYRRNPR